jgi:hypothetical protein
VTRPKTLSDADLLAAARPPVEAIVTPGPIATEKRTVSAMLRIYCAARHGGGDPLCPQCAALQRYSHARLDACPYGAGKPTCAACSIHCYKPAEREAMRQAMRFAGPKMTWRHPWLAVVHLWKARFHGTPRTHRGRPRVP